MSLEFLFGLPILAKQFIFLLNSSINFARIGTDITEALIEAIQFLSYRYSNDVRSSKPLPYGNIIESRTTECLKL